MISLLEIAKSIDEAEMKLKPKGGGKVVVFKNKDNYEDALKSGDYEEPEGSKKVKSKDSDIDFGRAADDEADDMDRDARFDADAEDDEKTSESENEKIISSMEDIAIDIYGGYSVDSEDSAIDDGQYAVISAADSGNPDNEMSVNAFPDGIGVGYGINVGSGHKMIYFDSKEEELEAAKKLLKNSRIRAAMDARSEETLADLGDHAESVLKSKDEIINVNLKEKYDRTFRSLK